MYMTYMCSMCMYVFIVSLSLPWTATRPPCEAGA